MGKNAVETRPMTKIFGIGWAKTGTTTLGRCFKILGYVHQSQRLDLVADVGRGDLSRIIALAKEKETFEDWPWVILYRELDRAFPGSLFVLTVRNPARWIRSYRNMLKNLGMATDDMNHTRRILYGLPFPDVTEADLIRRYKRHNSEVKDYFRDRPGQLLVVDWENGDGWPLLCDFLGRDLPDAPFPHANRGVYRPGLRARLARMIRRHNRRA